MAVGSQLFPKGGSGRAFGVAMATIAWFGFVAGLAGCPVAADLEDPTRFPWLKGAAGGTAGSGNVSCAQSLDSVDVGCDWRNILTGATGHCAVNGCHDSRFAVGELNLTPDDNLIARILEVPSKHESISCGGVPCVPSAMTCEDCDTCPSGPSDVLLSKTNVSGSWIMQKMAAFDVSTPTTTVNMRCGDAMPVPPRNSNFNEPKRQCLVDFFTWIAERGKKCDLGTPMGGAGGGGLGGAGSGGVATSGAGGT